MAHFLYEIITHLKNSKGFFVITVGTVSISMTIFGVFLLLFINFSNLIMGMGNDFQIVVFLKDGIAIHERHKVKKFLENQEAILNIEYISKGKALQIFISDLGVNSPILDGLDENPLPESFRVLLKKERHLPEFIEDIAVEVQKLKGVESVVYGKEWLEKFMTILLCVKVLFFFISVLLFLGLIFVIANTIKLSLFSHIKEIEIMKLVGASNYFIEMPFVVEGIIEGFLGALLSIAILFLTYKLLIGEIYQISGSHFFIDSITFIPASFLFGIVIFGMIIGCLGSLLSIQRFLKDV